ncbi:LysR family transcriptional regulator [Pantoea cypripedii]|uniref:LysR family transcriptional regulator n=1 Tax=Pantoea cypripedii TaxID=55209 RepID=A0A1X1EMK4_PANCY|nr:LysR family transcriptional regulator [Pantoea cypripedii]MBP2199279.1 DNA-binding transcriptional LysR family regulator [Pantoea cypripedii]ORM90042.1 LysR family transcriptional regulator [Pantoea cypripedii]
MAIAGHLISNNLPSVKQLQCFLAVAHELNFRRAAERLRMTQPPLTRQIKCLEAVLDQQLFSRNTHDVSLTEAGRLLVIKAEKLLQVLSELKTDSLSSEKSLRIGLTGTLNFELIEPVNRLLGTLEAGDDVETPYLTSAQLLRSLSKNTFDLVLTGEKGIGHEDIVQYRWVCREPLLMAMPAMHPASLKDKVSLEDVSDLPLFWFARSANPSFYDKCESYFDLLNFPLKKVKEPDDSLVMLTHIARGKGFALMPQSKCTFNLEGLCYRELADRESQKLNIDIYAATRLNEKREAVLNAQEVLCNNGFSY